MPRGHWAAGLAGQHVAAGSAAPGGWIPGPGLQPGDGAGQRQPVGCGHDLPRLGHRHQLLQLAAPLEYGDALVRTGGRTEYGISMKGPAATHRASPPVPCQPGI